MSDDISIPQAGPMPARTQFSRSYRTRRTGMDEGTRRLLIAAGALGLVLVAGMGVWSLTGHRATGVPVIEADSRPLRVKPDNPGGMQVIGANEQIMGGAGQGGGTDAMGPPAEMPDPQALRAQKLQAAAATPAPVPSAPVAPSAPVPAPAPLQAAPGPAASPLPDTPERAVARPAAPAKPAGGTMIQLGALESEQAAQSEWQRLAKRMPELLGDRRPVVQRAEHDGKPVFRIRTGGFTDTAEAAAFCGKVRAKGGACSIASF